MGATLPLVRQRPLVAIARHCASPSTRSITPLNSIASISRLYNTEAAATEQTAPATEDAAPKQTAPPTEDGPVELFGDLSKLGVHRNLIRCITDNMGYERMTPVQAKTINPALKGTDMYCTSAAPAGMAS